MKKKIFFILILFFILNLYAKDNTIIIYETKAFINESKKIDIKKGYNTINFSLNDENIDNNSIFLNIEDTDIKNLSYKFVDINDFEITSGLKVKVFLESKVIEGEVISFSNDLMLKTEKSIIKINRDKIISIEFFKNEAEMSMPNDLVINFYSTDTKKTNLDLSYFASSLKWFPKYNLILNENEDKMKLEINFIIKNNGNRSFKKSKLFVLAGDIQTENYHRKQPFLLKAAVHGVDESNITPEPLSDFYEYDIAGLYDLAAREMRTINFIKTDIKNFTKEYIYDSEIYKNNVFANFSFLNTKENNLGFPLPAGEIHSYIEKDKILHFIGKNNIKDTSEKEKIEIKTGQIFDIKVERKQIETNKIDEKIWDEKYSILFENFKNKKVKIKVKERINSLFWEIKESNFNYKKIDSRTIEFDLDIDAGKIFEIIYKVRKKY